MTNTSNAETAKKDSSSGSEEQLARLNLAEFWPVFLKFWWVCAVLAILGAGAMFVRSRLSFTPRYETSVTFTVQTQELGTSGGSTSYSFSYNRSTANQLSSTFPAIIQSHILQDVVCHDLGLPYMPASLSASAVPGTNMFTITAAGTDPQLTYDILQSVIRNYPAVAEYVIGNTTLTILTPPSIPTQPANRFAYRTQTLRGALLGLALGAGWIIFYTLCRQTVRGRKDIRLKLNQHCLGILPEVRFKKYKRRTPHGILLTNRMVGDAYLESLRTLRNAFTHAIPDGNSVVMITSTAPGEGKTTAAVNLALSLAKTGKHILLVDADLRNPSVNTLLEHEPAPENSSPIHIEQLPAFFNLSVLYFNTSTYRLWKIIRVDYLNKLFDQLREEYDYIIVDTPPLGLTSEPMIIAQAADAAIMVVKQDTIRTSRIISVLDTLLSSNVKLLGCLLNGADSSYSGYGYRYGRYGYGRRYGYGDGVSARRSDKQTAGQNAEQNTID